MDLMARINIVGMLIIFLVSKPVIKALRDCEAQKAGGVEKYRFEPLALGIKNAELWKDRIRKEKTM